MNAIHFLKSFVSLFSSFFLCTSYKFQWVWEKQAIVVLWQGGFRKRGLKTVLMRPRQGQAGQRWTEGRMGPMGAPPLSRQVLGWMGWLSEWSGPGTHQILKIGRRGLPPPYTHTHTFPHFTPIWLVLAGTVSSYFWPLHKHAGSNG